MKVLAVLVLSVLCGFMGGQMLTRTPAGAMTQAALQVARVASEDGQRVGSCFPIARVGKFTVYLTARHVATMAEDLLVDGKKVLKTETDPDRDVGVLWVLDSESTVLSLGHDPKRGDEILMAGYPLDHGWLAAHGVVGDSGDGGVWVCAFALFGMSGGAVLDRDGMVVGVTSGVMMGPTGPVTQMGLIVPVDSFRDWLNEVVKHAP